MRRSRKGKFLKDERGRGVIRACFSADAQDLSEMVPQRGQLKDWPLRKVKRTLAR